MGTAAYMSPEQIRGEKIDARTDLFSFGLVLYEMATGRPAFSGDTIAAVHDGILRAAPKPVRESNPELPTKLEEIISRALEKDRDLRYHSAGDLRAELKRLKRETDSARLPVEAGLVPAHQGQPLRRRLLALAGVVMVAVGVVGYWLTRPLPVPKVSNYVQLTYDGQRKFFLGTDGSRIYLGGGSSTHWVVTQVSVSGGEPVPIRTPSGAFFPLSVSPDGSELLAQQLQGPTSQTAALWSIPTLGGSPRRLGNIVGSEGGGAWSPDGQKLAYINGSDLLVANSDGSESHKLVSVAGSPFALDWSPDGSELRFSSYDDKTGGDSLWDISAQGTNLHPLLAGWHNPPDERYGKWTADGRYFVFLSQGRLWALSERRGFMRNANRTPVQLSVSPFSLSAPLPSKDGKKLFVVGRTYRGELLHYDLKAGRFSPFLSGISAEFVAFSPDGHWITYVTYPEGNLWRSKVDGSERLQLTYSPFWPALPRWSPDGRQIVFFSGDRIFVVSAEGGTPEQLMPDGPSPQYDPTWSPDGGKIVFSANTDANSTIRVLDLASHAVSTLPGSKGIYSPRWSPDGRYIAAMPVSALSLVLFDFQTGKWSELMKGELAFPNWSADGHYVYFLRAPRNPAVLRLRISNRKVEQVADMKDLPIAGAYGFWLGLAPDDSPMVLRDTGTQDVYALNVDFP